MAAEAPKEKKRARLIVDDAKAGHDDNSCIMLSMAKMEGARW
jgi:hypothetical protein